MQVGTPGITRNTAIHSKRPAGVNAPSLTKKRKKKRPDHTVNAPPFIFGGVNAPGRSQQVVRVRGMELFPEQAKVCFA